MKIEWINVKDQFPQNGEIVLCFEDTYGMFVAKYKRQSCNYEPGYFDIWEYCNCCGSEPPDPTHWMILPSPPIEYKE